MIHSDPDNMKCPGSGGTTPGMGGGNGTTPGMGGSTGTTPDMGGGTGTTPGMGGSNGTMPTMKSTSKGNIAASNVAANIALLILAFSAKFFI